MTRRESRENAFLLLFEQCFHPEPIEEIAALAAQMRDFETDDFTMQLAGGVNESLNEVDASFEPHLIKWQKNRISKVALCLLRIAAYEITRLEDIPVSVSINEAVELAKKYAGEEDAAFINGVLGSLARSVEEAK